MELSNKNINDNKAAIKAANCSFKGRGVRSYGARWGSILAKLGWAYKAEVSEAEFVYVNRKSFTNFSIRSMCFDKTKSIVENAKTMHEIYTLQKKKGKHSKEYALFFLKNADFSSMENKKLRQTLSELQKSAENPDKDPEKFQEGLKDMLASISYAEKNYRKTFDAAQKKDGKIDLKS